ncbi:hypothetical protein UAY_00130 [Enterococcus moraviensis ATCC BAA-383]|uniref:ABC transporter permease n=1 Tax=Enterococcus moraviensis ATCC BAA-383 TaxID=1158609 RepID=R2THX7_9ENTE|nr:YfhO family protein [Enterococcus moraviensis]EOI06788.1 hypothetical protein UAY_00130 [Enterococcus moraviensis ATCC BAA-383]EOT65125.1 hypothetical protein I586_02859 [Enterococcus moraviensis ATCC BAA-383]OJG66970.1 hypothetical protein RV09_GL003187 [Enterococcus moraviensis]
MNKAIKQFVKDEAWSLFMSIMIPIIILGVIYYQNGIYLGSEKTVLASDAYPQLSNFLASFHNVMHGKQSIFYTWYGSLGLNYWSLAAYYLNGIFTPLVYFFKNEAIADTFYLLTLLKFGAIGGSFWLFARQTFDLSKWLLAGLSISYALMGFSVAYSPMLMWLDAIMYLPLVILGIHRLMDKRKSGVLFVSYLLLFLSNFYLAFMIGVFSFLYYWVRYGTDPTRYKASILLYLVTAILAGTASMITVIPTVIDLSSNGETLSEISQFLTPDTGPWDLVVKSMTGKYDTAKYNGAPFIYISLLFLLFAGVYFFSKRINLRNKLLYGTLCLFLVLSIYIQPLNLFWHGLHAPNMLLFRFSFLLSFLLLTLSAYGLEVLEQEAVDSLLNSAILLLGLFLAAFLLANRKRYDYFSGRNVLITLGFISAYFILSYLLVKKNGWKQFIFIAMLLLVICEMAFNSHAMIQGIAKDWVYPERRGYTQKYHEIQTLVDQTKKEQSASYRMTNLDPISVNESFNFGYSGVSMFSSIRNRHSSMYLNELGFRSEGTNLNINYSNNTLIMDSVLGIQYNLAKNNPNKFGFTKEAQSGEYGLYKNKYALPLGIVTDKGIYADGAVHNQTTLLDYLAESQTTFVSFTEPKEISHENVLIQEEGPVVYYSEETPQAKKIMSWSISIPAHTQAYLSLYDVNDYSVAFKTKVEITVENEAARVYQMKDVGQYYDLGNYEKAKMIQVKVVFSGSPLVTILRPDVLLLDTEAFKTTIEKIKKKGVAFETSGRKAKAEVTLDKEQVIVTTIPYDQGWSVKIDGKKTEIIQFKEAFLSVTVPQGKHTIEFVFLPKGFKAGSILFGGSLTIYACFYWYKRRDRIN